jgi:thymidylate kinase
MARGLLVAIEGPSATGKSTVADVLARSTGWTILAEAYRRLRPRPSLEFRSDDELLRLERRLLAEEVRRYAEAVEAIGAGATVIADTGFLGPLTYTYALVRAGASAPEVLRSLLSDSRTHGDWGLADGYVYLDTPAATRAARARSDPAGTTAELAARHRTMGEIEREYYLEEFGPRWGTRFVVLAGDRPPSEVAPDVIRAVRSIERAPAPTVRRDDLLRALADAAGPADSRRGNR